MRCYTFFKGFRLPWPPSHCLNFKILFRFLLNKYFNALTSFQKEFSSPILLTKISPLRKSSILSSQFSIKKQNHKHQSIQSLRIGSDAFRPNTSNHLLYLIVLFFYFFLAILRETSRKTSY